MTQKIYKNQKEKYTTETRLESVISDFKQSMFDGFDMLFKAMDNIKIEIKSEMNQRFLEVDKKFLIMNQRFLEMDKRFISIDNRLLKIENEMVYKYELNTLTDNVL